MRPTDKEQIDYESIRKNYLKNFEMFCENLDAVKNEDCIKNEVKDYVKVSKDYKKQYKENIQKKQEEYNANDDSLFLDYDSYRGSKTTQIKNTKHSKHQSDIWSCQRVDGH